MLKRILDVIELEIAPLTAVSIEKEGNKVFGAAILRKSDLGLVIAETNRETVNPLFHGEIHCITQLYARGVDAVPDPKSCIFISTHEPCSLCLSAIAWSGYDNFYYLFSHEDSRDSFNIPHDLKILKEVFGLNAGGYNKANAFWTGHDIMKMEGHTDETRATGKASLLEFLQANLNTSPSGALETKVRRHVSELSAKKRWHKDSLELKAPPNTNFHFLRGTAFGWNKFCKSSNVIGVSAICCIVSKTMVT